MELVGRSTLSTLLARVDQSKASAIGSWVAEVETAEWFGSRDVIEQFPAAQEVGDNVWRFNLSAAVVIEARISFRRSQVIVRSAS